MLFDLCVCHAFFGPSILLRGCTHLNHAVQLKDSFQNHIYPYKIAQLEFN